MQVSSNSAPGKSDQWNAQIPKADPVHLCGRIADILALLENYGALGPSKGQQATLAVIHSDGVAFACGTCCNSCFANALLQ